MLILNIFSLHISTFQRIDLLLKNQAIPATSASSFEVQWSVAQWLQRTLASSYHSPESDGRRGYIYLNLKARIRIISISEQCHPSYCIERGNSNKLIQIGIKGFILIESFYYLIFIIFIKNSLILSWEPQDLVIDNQWLLRSVIMFFV